MFNRALNITASRLSVLALVLTATACSASGRSSDTPAVSNVSNPQAHLVAFLPMQEGYGPTDHDAYETTIAPIAADHGMGRVAAYSVSKYLKGAGPTKASTVGVWALASPQSMGEVMSDSRYQANMEHRDRIHDMPQAAMYMTTEEFSGEAPTADEVVLVGMLTMNQGYDFDDHHAYEASISEIAERHGMRLFKEYRVLDALSPGAPQVAAINFWALSSPEALGAVMRDPQYATHIEYRDQIHDMETTTMYFVAPREPGA